MVIVGERINSTRKDIAQAIEKRDAAFIQYEAQMQVEAGVDYIDVNAGALIEKESEGLAWLVETVQQITDKPLCIDSSNSEAIAGALKSHKGKCIINSITAEKGRFNSFLPLLKEYDCSVVALCADDSGIPTTTERRVEIAGRIIEDLIAEGIALADIYIDPIILPISTEPKVGVIGLDVIEQVKKKYPGVRTICGLSNISFGLPLRKLINQVFLIMAMQKGLDAAIIDPTHKQFLAYITAAETLLGKDEYGVNYISAYREGRLETGETEVAHEQGQ